MPRTARVAIVQLSHDEADFKGNLRRLRDAVERLKDHDLVVFPELALTGHEAVTSATPGELRRILRALHPEDVEAFHGHVAACRTRVVFGELVERDGQFLNLATYTDGTTRVSYAKTHVHWTEGFTPGTDFPVVETPIGRVGMLVCFDAAFPEVPRILRLAGAEIVINVSAIPDYFPIRIVHRRLQACSVDNQVFTLFANRTGPGFRGHSAAVDPTGEFLAIADETDAVLDVTLDLDVLEEWRKREPLLEYRRPELYAPLSRNLQSGGGP